MLLYRIRCIIDDDRFKLGRKGEIILVMPIIQHFEMPADDVDRAQRFYKDVFGWEMHKWSNPENPEKDYWYFETKDDKGNIGIGGGMMKRQSPEHTVTNYITVPAIDEYTSKLEQAGGRVIIPKTKIPDRGFYAVFLDSENNMFGLYEPNK
jgi:predicted enzyme related to lactoylglutathione lyase